MDEENWHRKLYLPHFFSYSEESTETNLFQKEELGFDFFFLSSHPTRI